MGRSGGASKIKNQSSTSTRSSIQSRASNQTPKDLFYQVCRLAQGDNAKYTLDEFEEDGGVSIYRLNSVLSNLQDSVTYGDEQKIAEISLLKNPSFNKEKFLKKMEEAKKDFPTQNDYNQFAKNQITGSDDFPEHFEKESKILREEYPDASSQEIFDKVINSAMSRIYDGHWEFGEHSEGLSIDYEWKASQIKEPIQKILEDCGGDPKIMEPYYLKENPLALLGGGNSDSFVQATGKVKKEVESDPNFFYFDSDGKILKS